MTIVMDCLSQDLTHGPLRVQLHARRLPYIARGGWRHDTSRLPPDHSSVLLHDGDVHLDAAVRRLHPSEAAGVVSA